MEDGLGDMEGGGEGVRRVTRGKGGSRERRGEVLQVEGVGGP